MASIRQKIGQCLIIGLSDKTLSDEERLFITENHIGGIVLFDRNIESPEQLHALISDIQALSSIQPLFIAIDMEGGRVARLREPFTQWPPLKKLGDIDSPHLSFQFSQYMAQELHAIGINLNFAPCIDTLTCSQNPVIGDRSISADPNAVARHASAIVRGYSKGQVIPCAKHFPGHGNTTIDSHYDLPIEETDLETLMERELIPFKKVFRSRLDFVMTGHILFQNIDPEWPVTLSEIFLKHFLREKMGYQNLVISDDLDMKALRKKYAIEEIAIRALQAGNQILLYCNEPESPQIALDALTKAVSDKILSIETIDKNYSQILRVKKTRLKSAGPLSLREALEVIGHSSHKELSEAIAMGKTV